MIISFLGSLGIILLVVAFSILILPENDPQAKKNIEILHQNNLW
jgi:hypothetical protein